MAETSAQKVFKREEMVTVAVFARAIGVSRRQAYNYVEWGPGNGGVLAFRFGRERALRIPREEIERFKQSRRVEEG